jgi:hypothetical protein
MVSTRLDAGGVEICEYEGAVPRLAILAEILTGEHGAVHDR